MWYNSKTNELQSTPPWGVSYLHHDLIVERYPDWQQVSNDFTPPVSAAQVRKQLTAQIDAMYQAKVEQIMKGINTATALGNPADKAKADLTATYAEWKTKLKEVLNA